LSLKMSILAQIVFSVVKGIFLSKSLTG